jgi:hypothetical protein
MPADRSLAYRCAALRTGSAVAGIPSTEIGPIWPLVRGRLACNHQPTAAEPATAMMNAETVTTAAHGRFALGLSHRLLAAAASARVDASSTVGARYQGRS